MITNSLRWILHWLGQGLKLWLFATVASICLVPLYLPLGLLEDGIRHFDDLAPLGKFGVVAGQIVCFAVGIAVFTAILASQLKDHPLRPFTARKKHEGASGDGTQRAEQVAAPNRSATN